MNFFPIIVVISTIVADLYSKYEIYKYFHSNNKLYTTIDVLGNWLRIRYVENKGMAFGIGSSLDPMIKNYLFTGLTILAIAVILYYYFSVKKKKLIVRTSLALILGGAAGNFVDKVFGFYLYEGKSELFYGKVVDFIDMGIGMNRWPTYNIADIAITLGVFILLALILLSKDEDLFNHSKNEIKP